MLTWLRRGFTKQKGNLKDGEIYLDKTKSRLTYKSEATEFDVETDSNKVTSISGSSTNVQYPSAKLLYDQLALKAAVSTTKVYRALVTQTSTNAPVATVLENSIGSIVWSRDSAGTYFGTLVGAFTANKCFFGSQLNDPAGGTMSISRVDADKVAIQTVTPAATPLKADDLLNAANIEILIYP